MYLHFLSEIELQNLSSIEVPVNNQQPEEPSTRYDDTEVQRIGNDDSSLFLSQTMSSLRNATKVLQTPLPRTKSSLSSIAKTESDTEGSDVVIPEDLSKLDKTVDTPSPLREKPMISVASKPLSAEKEPE